MKASGYADRHLELNRNTTFKPVIFTGRKEHVKERRHCAHPRDAQLNLFVVVFTTLNADYKQDPISSLTKGTPTRRLPYTKIPGKFFSIRQASPTPAPFERNLSRPPDRNPCFCNVY